MNNFIRNHGQSLFIVAFGIFSLGVFFSVQNTNNSAEVLSETEVNPASSRFFDDETKLSFFYPADIKLSKISEEDRASGIIGRLENEETVEPSILVTIRRENDLRIVANATGRSVIDIILDGIRRRYPVQFPGYEEVLIQKMNIDGRSGADITFSYDSPANESERVKQRMVAIETSDDQAVYISMQTTEVSYRSVNAQIFDKVIEEISFE